MVAVQPSPTFFDQTEGPPDGITFVSNASNTLKRMTHHEDAEPEESTFQEEFVLLEQRQVVVFVTCICLLSSNDSCHLFCIHAENL
jgi:hypothetical protein